MLFADCQPKTAKTEFAAGTPEYVANVAKSHTGKYLKRVLKKH